jgi:cytochrome c oxidase assembly protein subunit 15
MATLALLWWLTLRVRGSRWPPHTTVSPAVYYWSYAALATLIGQIFLGGWTSTHYAALACADHFPTCQGAWWPPLSFEQAFVFWHGTGINYEGGILPLAERTAIHMTHRLGALFTACVVGGLALYLLLQRTAGRALRQLAALVLALLSLQIGLGIANVVYLLPLPLAVAHNGGAALLLLTLITLIQGLKKSQEERL